MFSLNRQRLLSLKIASLAVMSVALCCVLAWHWLPHTQQDFESRATQYRSEGKYVEAIADYTRAIEVCESKGLSPVRIVYDRGCTYNKMKDYEAAADDLTYVASSSRFSAVEKASVLTQRAKAYIGLGYRYAAILDAEAILGEDPSHGIGPALLAEAEAMPLCNPKGQRKLSVADQTRRHLQLLPVDVLGCFEQVLLDIDDLGFEKTKYARTKARIEASYLCSGELGPVLDIVRPWAKLNGYTENSAAIEEFLASPGWEMMQEHLPDGAAMTVVDLVEYVAKDNEKVRVSRFDASFEGESFGLLDIRMTHGAAFMIDLLEDYEPDNGT